MRGWSYATGRSRLDFNLRDFIALEYLLINLDAIYVSGRLPPSAEYQFLIQLLPGIVSLHLAGTINGSIGLMKGLLGLSDAVSKRMKFSRLEQVRCDAQQRLEPGYGEDDENDVGAMFAVAGVDFGFDSWPSSEPDPPRRVMACSDDGLGFSLPDEDDADL